MIVFGDMTFCAGDGCAKFNACPRALSSVVRTLARQSQSRIAEFARPRELDCWTDPQQELGDKQDDHPSLFQS